MSADPFDGPIEPFPEDTFVTERGQDRHTYADPVHEEVETHVDPAVADAVHHVRDRFGVRGLRDLITLASYELEVAEAAVATLDTTSEQDEARLDEAFVGFVQEGRTDDDAAAGDAAPTR